ncbi:MAG: heme NO-binding domain-containing protein [Kangiellaceae bacterium]|nr:heme NO-binding domain-containing protein [Kangiellaceae bacterium]
MQGVIYTILADMVIDNYGMELWNEVISEASLDSGGAFTAGVQYSDSELIGIVNQLSQKLSVPVKDLIKVYGEYLFPQLLKQLPLNDLDMSSMRSFLLQVDSVIHKEVKRIHPDAYLPTFDYEQNESDCLTMLYRSKRKLCALSEGLLIGASNYFSTPININHSKCMHKGDDHCRLEIHMDVS